MHSKFIRSEFEKLYINYHPRLLAYVQRFINDNSTAQDLVQDSFMVLWNKQISHDTEETRRLLFVIARNRCLNYLKHKNIVDRHRYQLQAQVKIGEERLYNYDFSFIENEHPFLYQELECQIQRIMNWHLYILMYQPKNTKLYRQRQEFQLFIQQKRLH